MNLFGLEVQKVFLLDTFTQAERDNQNENVTGRIYNALLALNVPVERLFADSNREVFQKLCEIYESDFDGPIIIQFIGHGGGNGFGNNNKEHRVRLGWADIAEALGRINVKAQNQLIINATSVCDGSEINLINQHHDIFHAVIGSNVKKSSGVVDHNKDFYRNCHQGMDTFKAIKLINDSIKSYANIRQPENRNENEPDEINLQPEVNVLPEVDEYSIFICDNLH